ncbi:MAG: SGNH/GDSL hydrolase family protein [Thermodesulfobacteriota bacterium]
MKSRRILTHALDAGILLFIGLVLLVILGGGFKVVVLGQKISVTGISNPAFLACLLLLARFFLRVGLSNSLTFLVSLFLAAALGEVLLRWIDPPIALPALKEITEPCDLLGYRLVPLLKDRRILTNSHGLRDVEHNWEKEAGVRRILGIGDSFTFGYRVDLEDTYLKRLERKLNQSGSRWEVINAGVAGYQMWQYLRYFKEYGHRYEPDFVIVGVYLDDFHGGPGDGRHEEGPGRYRQLSHLKLANAVRNTLDTLCFELRHLGETPWLRSIRERRGYFLGTPDRLLVMGDAEPEVYRTFERRLAEFGEIALEHGAKIVILLIPDVIQLGDPSLQRLNRIIREMCDRQSMEFLDVTPVFEEHGRVEDLYLLPRDAHTGPEGHKVIAAALEEKIRHLSVEAGFRDLDPKRSGAIRR